MAADVCVAMLGSLFPVHLTLGWIPGGHRWSGSALVGTLLSLTARAEIVG